MKNISEPFIKRPVATTLLTLALVVFGVSCYRSLPVSSLPKVDYPVISVSVGYPGMNPEVMANSVASPLEKQFMEIDGLKEVRSQNSFGYTSMTLVFDLDKSIEVAAMDVQAAITRAGHRLPSDLPSPPVYSKMDPNNDPIFYLGLTSDTLTKGKLYDYAKTKVAQSINTIDGVSNVLVYGSPKALRLAVDPNKLLNLGIDYKDLIDAVRANSITYSTGTLKDKSKVLTVVTDGQLDQAEGYGNIVISNVNGTPVYLKNVAECKEALAAEDLSIHFWGKGIPSFETGVILAVKQVSGANTVEVAKKVKVLLPHLYKSLPRSINLVPIYDKSESILRSIGEVKETILIAFILVTIVIFFFLGRARETLIPVVAMPLSLLITFIIMKFLGYNLDNLSLMALTLSIGFLVDDAIVFLENTVRHMENGESPMQAAFKSARQISFTILSMTVSLMATFIPLVFMEGQIGRVFKEFSFTIIIAIFASGIISLTVTPVMCSRFLMPHIKGVQTSIERFSYGLEQKFLSWYARTLKFFIRQKWIALFIWTAALILMVGLFVMLPKSFLPKGDSGAMLGIFMSKSGSKPEKMQERQAKIDKIIRSHPSVKYTVTATGIPEHGMNSNIGFVVIVLSDRNARKLFSGSSKKVSIDAVCNEIRMMLFDIPGIIPMIRPLPVLDIETGAVGSDRGNFAYSITGNDIDQVYSASELLKQKIMQVKGIIPPTVNVNLKKDNPEIRVNYNRSKMFACGLNPAKVESLIKQAYSMNYIYLIKTPSEQYEVILSAKEADRNESGLKTMYTKNRWGGMVPFDTIAETKKQLGFLTIPHVNNFPSSTIYFNTAPGVPLSYITEQVDKTAKETLPPGVFGELVGEAKVFSSTVKSLTFLIFIAVFVMYIILGILYENFIHPLTVLSTIPLALVGGLLTLYLFNAEFSLYAFIGIFMLMGIIKKNGIIVVDFAVEKQKAGKSAAVAVQEACMERLRPILMTSVSTIFGVLPIALGFGADGASRMPLGLSVVGGIACAQILTLYVTPVVYIILDRFNKND